MAYTNHDDYIIYDSLFNISVNFIPYLGMQKADRAELAKQNG
jgi:hypothetical protein